MDKLKEKSYLKIPKKRFDPIALLLSIAGLAFVFITAGKASSIQHMLDIRGLIIVIGGTVFVLLFQFDFSSNFSSLKIVIKSLLGTPDKTLVKILKQLDEAILHDTRIEELRKGEFLDGELLNDVVYMYHKGMLYEEIDVFVTARIADEYVEREMAVSLLNKASLISPALGLFGTVLGLVSVLRSLENPSAIGSSMSLALLTTVYGTALGSLVFTPLAGRIEHHNVIFLEAHKQLLNKVAILIKRSERRISTVQLKKVNAYEVE